MPRKGDYYLAFHSWTKYTTEDIMRSNMLLGTLNLHIAEIACIVYDMPRNGDFSYLAFYSWTK
jgi:hypothetical protein